MLLSTAIRGCHDVSLRATGEHVIIEALYILIHILVISHYKLFYPQLAKCFVHTRYDPLPSLCPNPLFPYL